MSLTIIQWKKLIRSAELLAEVYCAFIVMIYYQFKTTSHHIHLY